MWEVRLWEFHFYIFLIELVHIFAVVVNVGIFKRIYSDFRIHPGIFFSQNVGLYGAVDALYYAIRSIRFC